MGFVQFVSNGPVDHREAGGRGRHRLLSFANSNLWPMEARRRREVAGWAVCRKFKLLSPAHIDTSSSLSFLNSLNLLQLQLQLKPI
jgi:hypothetical protein